MNKVVLKGRVTADPTINYSQDQMCIARGKIAVDRRKSKNNQNPGADFIEYVTFGHTAETFEKYIHKGSEICASGHIQTGSYTNKDNVKVYTTTVVIDEFDFCGSKAQSNNQEELPEPSTDADGFMNIPDGLEEELPFN